MSRTALITGGSNGIGRAVALMMAEQGIDVAINYYSDDAAAAEVVRLAGLKNVRAIAIKGDMGAMQDVDRISHAALDFLGHIDILFNNAGVFIDHSFLEATEEAYDRTLNTILKGTFFLTQKVARHMVEKGIAGRIVNTSSAVTRDPNDSPVDYAVAKAGINNFTKAVAAQLGTYGITFNAVLPGAIPTKINKWQFDDPDLREKFRRGSVLCQLGDVRYIAGAVKYFISEEAKWTTGALLSVDGGYTI
ncbi:MAG: SDR family oxidoreductase [Clostridia bacterium]|nr:SDR family oxidoreductase [Clostridia bacterium]